MQNDNKTVSSPTTVTQNKSFEDAHKLDKKIPQDLLMKYQNKWYILKAGLEYKANVLFRGGNWGITTEIVERTPDYVLAKAVFKTKDGIEFSNYGEASKLNVTNTNMHKYLLHLAVTRAECRVLRMATCAGYGAAEEMDWYGESNNKKEIPPSENDSKETSPAQITTLKKLGAKEIPETQGDAKKLIIELLDKKI